MMHMPLSQGQFVLVDDSDYRIFYDVRFCYRAERNGKQGYAVRHVKVDGKDRLSYLHRELVQPQPGQEVIFLNHDRLDCRRENLRAVSKEEARQHHRVRSDSQSRIKGVRFDRDGGTWSAHLWRDGYCRHIGTFYRQAEAEAAYEKALKEENPELHAAPQIWRRQEIEELGDMEGLKIMVAT